MATNSSPARIVRESIETPASRAMGSTPSPRLPSTASATCVSVHRIISSKDLLFPSSGQGFFLVRTTAALFCPFSPVEGSSFSASRYLWPAGPRLSSRRDVSALRAKPCAMVSCPARRRRVPTIVQCLCRHFAIVKVNRMVCEDLVVLVALACEQNHVSRARFFDRQVNGLRAVRLDHVFSAGLLHAHNNVADDLQRFLLPRVIACQDRQIAHAPGDFTHD